MSKYNKKTTTANVVVNHQGGLGKQLPKEIELVSLLSTGIGNSFYETESERESRLITLIREVGKKDPEFVAKALVYTRSVIGQRTVTHVGAVAALPVLRGTPLATRFFSKRDKKQAKGGIVYNLGDMLEIVSYYFLRNPGRPLPNALKRGFKLALESADTYELAKYKGTGKTVKLIDIVRLVRPKPSKEMEHSFELLYKGKLKQFNTAEDKNSKAGQDVAKKVKSGEIAVEEAQTVLAQMKADNWGELITTGKIGYLALLRNIGNISKTVAEEVFTEALKMLTNEEVIRKSLVFPHQIDLALTVLLERDLGSRFRRLVEALDKAYSLSIPNLSTLFPTGNTAVVLDTSGSMDTAVSMGSSRVSGSRALDKGALIAATLAKGISADMYVFSNICHKHNYNPLDSVVSIKNDLIESADGGGTSFESIFRRLDKQYDRVFVISDMQGGDTILHNSSYQTYCAKYGNPVIYSIDLCGYGTTMFKQQQKIVHLFGYSKDIYEAVKTAEVNPYTVIDEINKITI